VKDKFVGAVGIVSPPPPPPPQETSVRENISDKKTTLIKLVCWFAGLLVWN
jgi:hypothetical protein